VDRVGDEERPDLPDFLLLGLPWESEGTFNGLLLKPLQAHKVVAEIQGYSIGLQPSDRFLSCKLIARQCDG
jgi:hypothetical protein